MTKVGCPLNRFNGSDKVIMFCIDSMAKANSLFSGWSVTCPIELVSTLWVDLLYLKLKSESDEEESTK